MTGLLCISCTVYKFTKSTFIQFISMPFQHILFLKTSIYTVNKFTGRQHELHSCGYGLLLQEHTLVDKWRKP